MFDEANHDIRIAVQAEDRRTAERAWLPALIRSVDNLLFDLEELNLQGVVRVPPHLRDRSQQVLSMVPDRDPDQLRVRQKIVAMMDVLYSAQELLLRAKDPSRPVYVGEEETTQTA